MPATTYVSTNDAADALRCEPIQILRAIARGFLPGGRAGEDAPWQVCTADLDAYLRAGCPGLAMPAIDGRWFKADNFTMQRFENDISAACEGQRLPDQQVEQLLQDRPKGTLVVEVPLKATAEVVKVLDAPATPSP